MHKQEDFHHTPDQVQEAIAQAQALLDAQEIAGDERAHLLPVVVTLLTSKQIFYQQAPALGGLALPPNARH